MKLPKFIKINLEKNLTVITFFTFLRDVVLNYSIRNLALVFVYSMAAFYYIKDKCEDVARNLFIYGVPLLLLVCLYLTYIEITKQRIHDVNQPWKLFWNWLVWLFTVLFLFIYPTIYFANFLFGQQGYSLNAQVISKEKSTRKGVRYTAVLQQPHSFSEHTKVQVEEEVYSSLKIGDTYQECIYIGFLNIRYTLPHSTIKPNCTVSN